MKKNILVIDDDEGIRKAFHMAHEDTEYEIDTAESSEVGIMKSKVKPYELIYLGLKMSGLNGVETLNEIRKNNKTVPVYIVTAFYTEYLNQLKTARDKGIEFNIIQKPIGMDQIIKATKSILNNPLSDI